MPRIAKELSALDVKRLQHPGRGRNVTFNVGGVAGLVLQITPNGGRTWLLRVLVGAKRREIGLGGYPEVTLAIARDRAREAKDKIRNGIDPVEERKAAKAALSAAQRRGLTFADAVDRYLDAKLDAFKNLKHRQQWRNTLATYAAPELGAMLVQDVTTQDVQRVLEPIWQDRTETASRLRGRIEAVLSWSTVAGHRTGDNPARWAGNLKELMPAPSKVARSGNHPAVQIDDAPRWFAALQSRSGVGSRALELAALTATRSQEVRGALWEEIDLEAALWVIPAARMKADREHRVAECRRAGVDYQPAARAGGQGLERHSANERRQAVTVMQSNIEALAIPFVTEGPQPLLREISQGEAYPIHALGPLQSPVQAVQGMTLAPIAIPAASALAVASLAVQPFGDVETLGGSRPLSLYALTIAQSGERKSSCDAPLMAALRAFEREQAAAHRQDMQTWQNNHALWKGERDRILAEARRGNGEKLTAAQADLIAMGKEPTAPPSPERTVTEPTYEGLTRKFAEGMPTLGIFSDEGGQFLGGYAMSSDNRQKTLAALNDLWQGNPIRRTRQGDGSLTLFGRRLAVHLMVQPGVARTFMADPMAADTGFLPRFLICEPTSTIGNRPQSAVRRDQGALDVFGGRLREILETALHADLESMELQPRIVALSSDARMILTRFADDAATAQARGGKYAHVTGYASKAAEQACRIAGVLTLWRDLHAPDISGAAMANGIDLARFYLGEAARLSDAANLSAEIERAEALRIWLLTRWNDAEIIPSEVVQYAPIRALRESPSARAAMALLEKHGWLVALEPGTVIRGKRRKEAFRIVKASNEV